MAFTYSGDLSTDLDKVRFHLQDTTEDDGPKPSGDNFTDAELSGLVTTEGNWQRAVAAGLGVLASAWRRYADIQVGSRREMYHLIANGYAADAKRWREEQGISSTSTGGSAWLTRVDGYSDDIDAGEA